MSRSYRRPFAAITGLASAKNDKKLAHRGVRRKQDRALKTCTNYDELFLPHRLECPWNDTWVWDRDGEKHYHGPLRNSPDARDLKYYLKLLRK